MYNKKQGSYPNSKNGYANLIIIIIRTAFWSILYYRGNKNYKKDEYNFPIFK